MRLSRPKVGVSKPRSSSVSGTPAGPSRSGIPKYKHTESTNKNQIPKGKRPPSLEKISRISLGINRNTPSKFTTPIQNHKYLALPSTNSKRQSTDTVRSSFGGKSRKEGFPVGDPSFKTQCIDKMMEFLRNHHYDQPYDRNMLKVPTGKDFASIFSFVFKFIDPNYKLPLKFEDDLPRLLKALKYPVQMSRSSFLNVGSPHSWPSVLAMLVWLIDVIAFSEVFSPENVAFEKDFDDPIDLKEKKFMLLISDYLENGADHEKYVKEYKTYVYKNGGLSANDQMILIEEEEKLKLEMDQIPDTMSQVIFCQRQYNELNADKGKLENFIRELKSHFSSKDNELIELSMELEEKEGNAREILHHTERLQKLKSQQNMNASELKRFKNHAADILTSINHQRNEERNLHKQIDASQMEISKNQHYLSNALCKYDCISNRLQLENCKLISTNSEGDLKYWEENVLPLLKMEKKKVKELTFDAQIVANSEKVNQDKVEEEVQETEKDILKLDRKFKRLDEETKALKDQIILEEQKLQEECDKLNEKLSQVRRTPKSSLYENQLLLEEVKKEYKQFSMLDQQERAKAKDFFAQCSHHVANFLQEKKQRDIQHVSEMMESQTKHLQDILYILKVDMEPK